MELRCYRYNFRYILFTNIMGCRPKILIKKLVKKKKKKKEKKKKKKIE